MNEGASLIIISSVKTWSGKIIFPISEVVFAPSPIHSLSVVRDAVPRGEGRKSASSRVRLLGVWARGKSFSCSVICPTSSAAGDGGGVFFVQVSIGQSTASSICTSTSKRHFQSTSLTFPSTFQLITHHVRIHQTSLHHVGHADTHEHRSPFGRSFSSWIVRPSRERNHDPRRRPSHHQHQRPISPFRHGRYAHQLFPRRR